MSDPRRRARKLAATALALAPLFSPLLNPATASAAAAPGALAPSAGDGWAGYAATGSTYTSVSATWVQPTIACTASGQYAAFWVGLDGYSSASVEQAGTEAECVGKTVEYSAWYELYPSPPVSYTNTIKAGDKVSASVVFSGTSTYTFTVTDATQGWSRTATKTAAGLARSSAEVVVEAPTPAMLPGPGFAAVTFSGCMVNGKTLGSADPTAITSPGLTVSPLTDGTNFTVTRSVSAI
jgi:Peptidase A4 family